MASPFMSSLIARDLVASLDAELSSAAERTRRAREAGSPRVGRAARLRGSFGRRLILVGVRLVGTPVEVE